jgi:hypothetical protein
MATRDRRKRLDVELSDAEWERLESERGLVSRSAWVRARLFPPAGSAEVSAGAVRGVAFPAAASSGAAPPSTLDAVSSQGPRGKISRPMVPLPPGVVRGSDLAKRNVKPIPKKGSK